MDEKGVIEATVDGDDFPFHPRLPRVIEFFSLDLAGVACTSVSHGDTLKTYRVSLSLSVGWPRESMKNTRIDLPGLISFPFFQYFLHNHASQCGVFARYRRGTGH